MKTTEATCRLCGKNLFEIGGYLTRVNLKGEDGIWECRPNCNAQQSQETNLLQAIEAPADKEPS